MFELFRMVEYRRERSSRSQFRTSTLVQGATKIHEEPIEEETIDCRDVLESLGGLKNNNI